MSGYRSEAYIMPESVSEKDYVVATYLVQAETVDYLRLAANIASQQSTGSWLRLPQETDDLIERHGAKVISTYEAPAYEYTIPQGVRNFIIQIAFPAINFDQDLPIVLTTIIGEVSTMGSIKLLDVTFPQSFVEGFPGPRFGIQGMREYLSIPVRPLIESVIKPCMGLSPQEAADVFYKAACGGADVIKDDEILGNTHYSKVVDRVKACMAAEKRAFEETGEHTYYAVNVTARPNRLLDYARAAMDAGANMLLLSPLTVGYGAIHMLAESPEFNVPILSHPNLAGGLSWSQNSGISPHLTLGKFPRLCGADLAIVYTTFGKATLNRESSIKASFALRQPFHHIKPAWSIQGGGVTPGMVQAMMEDLGNDIVIGVGGGIVGHPMGPRAGALAFRQAVDSVLDGTGLIEAAKRYPELNAALQAWGIVGAENQAALGLTK